MQVHVSPTPDAMASSAAEFIAAKLRSVDGPSTLGLAGGSTPRSTYRYLKREHVPWSQVGLWLGDERWVTPNHEDSNALMARQELAEHVPARLHAPDVSLGNPEEVATAYEITLERFMTMSDGMLQPDVVVLGMGDDGHTASLFPETVVLSERERRYSSVYVPQLDTWRLTATFPLLWSARTVVFLVTGESKAARLAEVIEGSSDLPAALVARGAQDSHWFVDTAAAGELSNS